MVRTASPSLSTARRQPGASSPRGVETAVAVRSAAVRRRATTVRSGAPSGPFTRSVTRGSAEGERVEDVEGLPPRPPLDLEVAAPLVVVAPVAARERQEPRQDRGDRDPV